ncbi:response regulator transcription factor [Clostridium saudiense]|uniref:response regulator transcription factor n=1 Tax=Clostridium saudiense TaxID=1414720 RepID=UPI00319DAF95
MVKLLIADDESFTRQGILETIPWKALNISEVREAYDGQNALEIIKDFEPDILLTDVRMPRLNGIELSFKVRELYPNCSIIFMSGFSDKEYLKSAIHLKAISYVEKPIDLDELEISIRNAVTEAQKSKIIYKNIKDNIVLDLINSITNDEINLLLSSHYNSDYYLSLLDKPSVIVCLNLINCINIDQNLIISNLQNLISIYNMESLISFINKKQIIINLFLKNTIKSLISNSEFNSLLFSVSEYINNFTPLNFCIGNIFNNIYDIKNAYTDIIKIVNSAFFYNHNSVIYLENFNPKIYVLNNDIYDDFQKYLVNEDKSSLLLLTKELTNEIKNYPSTSISYVKDIYYNLLLKVINFSNDRKIDISTHIDSNSLFEDILQLNTIFEINSYLIDKINNFFKLLEEKNNNNKPILNILKFIHENYADVNLSLEEISKNIFLTPAHICVIFKDHTNTTVNKYITEYRLDKAKTLLQDPSIKMNEIASSVGYRDGNYFAKIFKKEVGYSPSEYRRKFT